MQLSFELSPFIQIYSPLKPFFHVPKLLIMLNLLPEFLDQGEYFIFWLNYLLFIVGVAVLNDLAFDFSVQ